MAFADTKYDAPDYIYALQRQKQQGNMVLVYPRNAGRACIRVALEKVSALQQTPPSLLDVPPLSLCQWVREGGCECCHLAPFMPRARVHAGLQMPLLTAEVNLTVVERTELEPPLLHLIESQIAHVMARRGAGRRAIALDTNGAYFLSTENTSVRARAKAVWVYCCAARNAHRLARASHRWSRCKATAPSRLASRAPRWWLFTTEVSPVVFHTCSLCPPHTSPSPTFFHWFLAWPGCLAGLMHAKSLPSTYVTVHTPVLLVMEIESCVTAQEHCYLQAGHANSLQLRLFGHNQKEISLENVRPR
jgi:hypothetical protein